MVKNKVQDRNQDFQFVRPINSIIETKFQLRIPTERRCSRTVLFCPLAIKRH